MELYEKLQKLRKQKGLTQEELAAALYVSRTAVSKWESGRGYPSIDSLKAIAKYFSVTIDELLSGEEILQIAKEDSRQRTEDLSLLIFSVLDLCSLLLFILPVFRNSTGEAVRAVTLMQLSAVAPFLRILFLSVVFAMAGAGLVNLGLRVCIFKKRAAVSIALNILATLCFVIGLHPYAAVLMVSFLTIKVIILVNGR